MGPNSQKNTGNLQPGELKPQEGFDISVCIVTYQSRDLLRDCLYSLFKNTTHKSEVIVVDNGSTDGITEMLEKEYPVVRVIKNKENLGYTRPMNQALKDGKGRYLLQLNPDTLILPGAIDTLIDYMDHNSNVGICGPKVLNADLTLQSPCRRGEPTPWAVISYFLGLSRLFPKSKFFGQYLLNYMGEDLVHSVDGLSGSCMLIRREVIDQIGYLDEQFFAYQEDADFCHRARQAGWQIIYMPEAKIIHYGGMGGSRVEPYRSILAWHKSYYIYYKKNLAHHYFFLFNWFYYLIMVVKLGLTLLINFLRKEKIASTLRPLADKSREREQG